MLSLEQSTLQEFEDDNRFLDDLLLAARDAMADATSRQLRIEPLVELLGRVRDRLSDRFSREESLGYFDAANSPDASSAMAGQQEHRSLYSELCDIVGAAERLRSGESIENRVRSIERISASFVVFYRRFVDHQRNESEVAKHVLSKCRGGGANLFGHLHAGPTETSAKGG